MVVSLLLLQLKKGFISLSVEVCKATLTLVLEPLIVLDYGLGLESVHVDLNLVLF